MGSLAAVRRLLAARFLRSVWQGALVADFALYLARLHWSGGGIGLLFAASFVVGAVLSAAVGPLADRCGYRRLLVGYEAVLAALFVLAAGSTRPPLITLAAVLGGFGRGANGAPGCFVPAELAWLAALLPERQRAHVFSLNTACGFIGMAVGAAIAVEPALFAAAPAGAAAFRPLFALGAVLSLANAGLLATAPAAGDDRGTAGAAGRAPLGAARRGRLAWVGAANVCNGLSVGLSGPLIAYWFAAKFGAGPLRIGPLMVFAFLAAAACATVVGRSARRMAAALYLRLQGVSLLVMLAIPFIGDFGLAATAWIVKFALERGAGGAMEAVNVGLAGAGRWGLASGLSVASLALPRAVGPALAGHWIASGALAAPLLAAAGLQAVHLLLYRHAVLPWPRRGGALAKAHPAA